MFSSFAIAREKTSIHVCTLIEPISVKSQIQLKNRKQIEERNKEN